MTTKIKAVALESARVKVSNETNENKVYDITATVAVSMSGTVDSVDSGEVHKDGGTIANFNAWGEDGLSVNYQSVPADKRCEVMDAISEFVTDCRSGSAGLLTGVDAAVE